MFPKQNAFDASSSGASFGIFGNNANTQSSFAQTFSKAATTFGQPTAFGTQNTGLLGTPQTSTSLFNTGTTNTFDSTPAPQTNFGAFSQPQNLTVSFGAFSQPQTFTVSFNAFSQPQTFTVSFGAPQQTTQSTLFGQNTNTAFGTQNKPAFGFHQTQPTNSIFGTTTAASNNTSFSSFGTSQNTSVFGSASTAFGETNQTANAGTSIAKYQPSFGTYTEIKNGQPKDVSTKTQCITAMEEYENKSYEELRFEDYLSNRKGGSQGNTSIFGQQPNLTIKPSHSVTIDMSIVSATNDNNSFNSFGTTDAFGAKPAFNQFAGTNLFGQNPIETSTAFGQTSTFNTLGQLIHNHLSLAITR